MFVRVDSNMIGYRVRYCFALFFSLNIWSSWAFSPETHELLTREAIQRSVVGSESGMREKTGFGIDQVFPGFVGNSAEPDGRYRVARNAAGYGAIHEDEVNVLPHPACNHFYDPQNSGRELTVLGVNCGQPSPRWALEDVADFDIQAYSYREGQKYLYKTFSGATELERTAAAGRVFQTLGHIVHHIQDMAQPQHVRNEAHLDIIKPMPEAAYEAIALTKLSEQKIAALIAARTYAAPMFSNASDYWSLPGAPFTGMADFASKNFVTYSKSYRYNNTTGTLDVVGDYPLPNQYNVSDGSLRAVVSKLVTFRSLFGVEFYQNMLYLNGEIFDDYVGGRTSDKNQVVGVGRLIGALGGGKYTYFNWDDPVVRENGWSFLIPRAVAFSSGLINHFFRGKFTVARSGEQGKWLLSNGTNLPMWGKVSFYLRNVGTGSQVLLRQVPDVSVPGGGSAIIEIEEPAQAQLSNSDQLVVVFAGRIGSEGDKDLVGSYAVAGASIGYVPPLKNTETLLTADRSVLSFGESVTLSASVRGGGATTGNVVFSIVGGSVVGTSQITSDGEASILVNNLPQGAYGVMASYGGDSKNKPSVSGALQMTVRPPPAPCGTPLSASGGSAGMTRVMEMGSTPGLVSVKFSAYSIKDGLQVKYSKSGLVLATTSGLVSGEHSFSFQYNPAQNGGATTLEFKVTGNTDGNTLWDIKSSCPGGAVEDFSRYRLTYGVDRSSGGGKSCGKWGFWLDSDFSSAPTRTIANPGATSVDVTAGGVHYLAVVFSGSCPSGLGYDPGRPYFNTGKGKVYFDGFGAAVIRPNSTGYAGQAN